MQNHLSKPEDLMLQNATPLRKSAPGPPNSSDEHVSCTAPATGNPSFQILLFKCPTPAIVFGNARKPSRFAHFWQGAQSLAPATQNNASTSTSGAYMWRFVDVGFEMCFAPQRRALFRHLNFKKCYEPLSFLPFWLRNVLRATTACTFSTSQFPKVVRAWCVLYILTWKCDSRPNGVQFFISHLASWLRSFSEPTFRPSGATNHWKNTVFRDFPTFSRICIFFLLTLSLLLFSLLYNLSLLSDPFHLCFSSVHIVGRLTSKLPSIIYLSRTFTTNISGSLARRCPPWAVDGTGCCDKGPWKPSAPTWAVEPRLNSNKWAYVGSLMEYAGIYGFKLWDMAGDVLILQPDRICGNTMEHLQWPKFLEPARAIPQQHTTSINSAVPWGLNEEKLKYFFGVGSFLCSSRSYSSCLCASPLLRMSREARNPSSPILKYMIMPQRSLSSCARILSSQNIQYLGIQTHSIPA